MNKMYMVMLFATVVYGKSVPDGRQLKSMKSAEVTKAPKSSKSSKSSKGATDVPETTTTAEPTTTTTAPVCEEICGDCDPCPAECIGFGGCCDGEEC
jgi:hypothetical protein